MPIPLPRLARLLLLVAGLAAGARPVCADWKNDYAVADGFRLTQDTSGFRFPTAIAFVPKPGPGPKDPLYFVTELRGVVKVVTNDRTVSVFAEGFSRLIPKKELLDHMGEIGVVGICLDPEHGYVFVSHAYEDEDGIYRNGIVRFDTAPGTFATRPTARKNLAPMLAGHLSNVAHQIGPMAIKDGLLYVSIGDAYSPVSARDPEFPNGKVLRMTLDGDPVADNPFAVDGDDLRARNYVWALGFRNPFSLTFAKERLFVAENGLDLDRFLEVHRGADYLFGGIQEAVASNALFVWTPAASPVQMLYDDGAAARNGFPAPWRDKFYVALGGSPSDRPGPAARKKNVSTIGFDFATGRVTELPKPILRYTGSGMQLLIGVGFGPDGLYVVPLMPDVDGISAVLRLDYRPDAPHANIITAARGATEIMDANQCFGCHKIDGRGLGNNGPEIVRRQLADKLLSWLDSPEYAEQVARIDALKSEPYVNYRDARAAVLAAKGEEKARLWVKYRILEPRFDRTAVAMPRVGLTDQEADTVATWLLDASGDDVLRRKVKAAMQVPKYRMIFFLGVGAASGVLGSGLLFLFWRRRERARRGAGV